MTIKISFVVPCFNEQKYLPKLLKSINECITSNIDIEVIVVDNFSTDETLMAIWNLIPHMKYKLIIAHEYEKGVSAARNLGAQTASGDYLVFLDADNYISVKFFNDLVDLTNRQDVMGATIRTLAEPVSMMGQFVFLVLELFKMYLNKPFGKSVVARDAFFIVGGFNLKIKLGENVDFHTRVRNLSFIQNKKYLHIKGPIFASLRRFEKVGYLKILIPWFIAYLGCHSLQYDTVDTL